MGLEIEMLNTVKMAHRDINVQKKKFAELEEMVWKKGSPGKVRSRAMMSGGNT
jgi:hypothetical protein